MVCHHVDAGEYVRTARGIQPPGLLTGMVLRHVIEVCDQCRQTWELLPVPMQQAVLQRLSQHEPPFNRTPPLAEHLSLRQTSIDDDEADLARLRREYNLVRFSLDKLLALEPGAWRHKIERSKKRFRSRMMVDLMLSRVREWTSAKPTRAQSLANVTALVVDRIPGSGDEPWRIELSALTIAQEANAARVAGDFLTASRLFATVHAKLADCDVADLSLRGRLASLEASLRNDQREFEEASRQLNIATLLFRSAGDYRNSAIALVQTAILQRTTGSAESALRSAERAATVLGDDRSGYLYLSTVTTRANALCDLDRPNEAMRLLDAHEEDFDESEQVHVGAVLRGIRGRVALGLGQFRQACQHFDDAREAYLHLGRDYDAALASLDFAQALLQAGEINRLHQEAGALVRLFRDSGVQRETLASLALLAKAARAGTLTTRILTEVRRAINDQAMTGRQTFPTQID